MTSRPCLGSARLKLWLVMAPLLFATVSPAAWAGFAEDLLRKEADYIVDCSYTRHAQNLPSNTPTRDATGALNNVRIHNSGPDWVVPSEGAVGMIGLMQAARVLRDDGQSVSTYERVMDAYFDRWLISKRQAIVGSGTHRGGVVSRIFYNSNGQYDRREGANTGSTGITMVAMYKRYEYLRDTGRKSQADAWLKNDKAWRVMKDGFDFINRNYNSTHKMVRARSGQNNLWVTDTVLSACALRCFEQWAKKSGRSAGNSRSRANDLVSGINRMRDDGGDWKNFYRFRDAGKNFNRTYGDRIDQICHLPFESGLISPGDRFAEQISGWWTNGSTNSPRMTYQTNQSSNWRYFGTRWKYFLNSSPASNDYLYPGPALQLAKMEWRTGKARNKSFMVTRAERRFAFANNKSNLWLGEGSTKEANVPNGIVDWRNAKNYSQKADNYLRFVDTSSYMIQVNNMIFFNRDTRYTPQ